MKTALHYFAPHLLPGAPLVERAPDPRYEWARDRHPVRKKFNQTSGWSERCDADGFIFRDYGSYDEYLTHQQQKLPELLRSRGGFTRGEILHFRLKFYRRFRKLCGLVPRDAVVLCAGARQGTEVEVLRELGFEQAFGIDLNPGPDNPFVRPGDFMHLENADASVDLFYTNCADHAFDLDGFFAEHSRILKPSGYAIYDIATPCPRVRGAPLGAFETVTWRRAEDAVTLLLRHFAELIRVERDGMWLSITVRGGRGQKSVLPPAGCGPKALRPP